LSVLCTLLHINGDEWQPLLIRSALPTTLPTRSNLQFEDHHRHVWPSSIIILMGVIKPHWLSDRSRDQVRFISPNDNFQSSSAPSTEEPATFNDNFVVEHPRNLIQHIDMDLGSAYSCRNEHFGMLRWTSIGCSPEPRDVSN